MAGRSGERMLGQEERPLSELTADQEAVVDLVCSKIRRLFKADGCAIMSVEDGRVEVLASEGAVGPYQKGTSFSMGEVPLGPVVSALKTVRVDDLRSEEELSKYQWPEGARAALLAPVLVGRDATGAIALFSKREGAFGDYDALILESLCQQVAVVLRRVQVFREMERIATTDSLTGLRNFRFFRRRLEEEVDRAERYGVTFSVVLVDIDGLGRFNEEQGFVAGDLLIREVGQILRSNTRRVDLVARYGGGRFAILMPETDRTGAMAAAKKLVSKVAEAAFMDMRGERRAKATVRAGVATYPVDGRSADDLLRRAGEALDEAKRRGGNCAAVPPSTGT